VADDFAVKTLDEFVDFWERLTQAGKRSWGVWRDGELGGAIWSTRFSPVAADSHCIFKRAFWGHGTTAEALNLVYADVFAAGVEKISIVCFSDNHSLLGLVRKLGFEREGTLKKSTLRGGVLVDQAVIGLTRERFAAQVPPSNEGGKVKIEPVEEKDATCVSS
jgi:RimJ/RimL family protein N-acetyltransferase